MNVTKNASRYFLLSTVALGLLSWSAKTNAQLYPDTLWVPVIFYDFHSDGSCPEFNTNIIAGPLPGMVVNNKLNYDTLNAHYFNRPQFGVTFDSIAKPICTSDPTKVDGNAYMKYWFKPWAHATSWATAAKGDFTRPNYWPAGAPVAGGPLLSIQTVTYDTSFIDSVVKDSLPFLCIDQAKGIYQFNRGGPTVGQPEFFWIDNKGFGNDANGWTDAKGNSRHNFSFAMEMHWKFTMQPNMTFNFGGDDDVWVFINGQLALDLGAPHTYAAGSFNLDQIPGLVVGQTYTLDMFYCERHVTDSDLLITTNVISAKPAVLQLNVSPSTTIRAGDTLTATAVVLDQNNKPLTNLTGTLTWGLIDNYNPQSTLKSTSNTQAIFTPTEAYTTAYIWGKYTDGSILITDTIAVKVIPGPPSHIVIEASDDSTQSLRNDNKRGPLSLLNTQTSSNQLYAIARDKFGNWVFPANPATWSSDNTTIVTASSGPLPARGQGLVTRQTPTSGQTIVRASYVYNGKTMTDSLNVSVDNITYNALRIVVQQGNAYYPITTLSMQTSVDTTLWVEGQRSDNGVWEVISGTWSYTSVVVAPAPVGSVPSWKFHAMQTGTGQILVSSTSGTTGPISAAIAAIFSHGPPDHMILYNAAGDPAAAGVDSLASTINVVAGTPQPIDAKLFDNLNEWLNEFETVDSLSNRIQWQISDNTLASINPTTGHLTVFTSTNAHHTFTVTATYPNANLSRTITINVVPAAASQLVIEPNNNGLTLSPNAPQSFPNNTVTITSNQTYRSAYAVLRDRYGNWVGFSQGTSWNTNPTGVVTIDIGIAFQGEGLIYRIPTVPSGTTVATAHDIANNLSGQVTVSVLAYYYTELRIYVKGVADSLIDSLTINTNQDTTLYVLGRRSDDSTKWEPVSVTWQNAANLNNAITSPGNAGSWKVSPTDTGSGWIRVTTGDDATTAPDTVNVTFTPGPPTKVTITVTTPDYARIAGSPIDVQVTIDNNDGLVPGTWCGSAVFGDLLVPATPQKTADGKTVVPSVIIGNDTIPLDSAAHLCFSGGVATVQLLLYYAPPTLDLHTISVTLPSSALTDSTKMVLLPGTVSSINIVSSPTPPTQFPGDSIAMAYNEGKTIYAVGYDAYGNLTGSVNGNWSVSGGIPAIARPGNTPQLYYTAGGVVYQSTGYIHVTYTGNATVVDSILVDISAPKPVLLSATTQDLNGDGYLDAIVLKFDKNVSFPAGFNLTNFIIAGPTEPNGTPMYFVVDSIGPTDSLSSTFTLYLKEDSTSLPGVPQTNWIPKITIANDNTIASVNNQNCVDGAGPVIWSVEKVANSADDRTLDKVTVVFSEPILAANGSPFAIGTPPDSVFNVWVLDPTTGRYVEVPSLLDSIDHFSMVNDSSLVFYMTNGHDLTGLDYFSINTTPAPLLGDLKQNTPGANNQIVRVQVIGALGAITSGPNPMFPVFQHFYSQLSYVAPQDAFNWAKNEGGAVMVANIHLPSDQAANKVTGALMVFDAVGNLVYSKANNDNVIPPSMQDPSLAGTTQQLVFYWNGITAQNRKAAPGVYRVLLYISTNTKQQKFQSNIGIGR